MWKASLDESGEVTIPMELRQRSGFTPGMEFVLVAAGKGELRMMTLEAAQRKAQVLATELSVPWPSTFEESFVDRRRK
jgi:bifunctional DNA-binding transcriptional regulator/antitoxin component of YhaV-PrlF toxin-antitoxin module